jgi:hypothetical protein
MDIFICALFFHLLGPFIFQTEGVSMKDSKSFSRPTKTYSTLLNPQIIFAHGRYGTLPTILPPYDTFFWLRKAHLTLGGDIAHSKICFYLVAFWD